MTSPSSVQQDAVSAFLLLGIAAIVLLKQDLDAEKASLLIKARRLVVAATSQTVTRSYLQDRMKQNRPLPSVALIPARERHNKLGVVLIFLFGQWAGPREGDEKVDDKQARELRSLLAFLLGMEGGLKGEGMPREVFLLVLDMLMPSWDPLRRELVHAKAPKQG